MPFQPQALDERTLKAFVDRLLESLRQSSPTPPKRSAAQETVARMLGFPHWHAAITAIGAPRPQPAPTSQSAGPNVGLYPAEPMVFTPDHAEALLMWAFSVGAHQVTVQEGERLYIQRPNRLHPVSHRVMTAQDEEAFAMALKSPRSPEELKTKDSEWVITLKSPSQDHLRIRANRVSTNQGMQLHLTLFPALPLDLAYVIKNPELEHQLTSSRGLVLLTGGTSSGKTTLMSALMKSLLQQPGQQIVSLEDPITFDYENLPMAVATGTTLIQHEGGNTAEIFNDNIVQIMRKPPAVLFVDRCRHYSTLETCVAASSASTRVFLNQHSDNVPMALTRALGEDWKKSAANMVASLGMVVSQCLLPQDNGTVLALHEWLVFTPEVKQACIETLAQSQTKYHFRALLEDVLEQHGHTFEAHGQRLFDQGLVSEKTLKELMRFQAMRRQWKHKKEWR